MLPELPPSRWIAKHKLFSRFHMRVSLSDSRIPYANVNGMQHTSLPSHRVMPDLEAVALLFMMRRPFEGDEFVRTLELTHPVCSLLGIARIHSSFCPTFAVRHDGAQPRSCLYRLVGPSSSIEIPSLGFEPHLVARKLLFLHG